MKNKAVFLDRDGVINRELGHYVSSIDDFIVNPGVLQSIVKMKQAGYLVILITNQGGIARGLYSKQKVDCMHDVLNEQLTRLNLELDAIYICPHHDKFEKCLCRKPNSLMLEKAIARFNIDPARSIMIGDSDRDVQAAEKAGVRGVKVESNSNLLKTLEGLI